MSSQSLPPNEETTGLDTYTKWVWRKWLGVLASVEFALLTFIWGLTGFTITNLPLLISIYLALFMIQIYIATYHLWEDERKDKLLIIEIVDNKNSQIEKLTFDKDNFEQEARQLRIVLLQREKDRKPNLVGSAKDIQIDIVLDKVNKNILGTRVVIYLGISNASTVPTTIGEFILDVTDTNGGHFLSHAGHDPSKFGLSQRECKMFLSLWFDTGQQLVNRFRNGQKAELGERHEGWIFFDFDSIQKPNENFDWSNMVLKVVDAFDEKHQISGGLLKRYDEVG